MLGTIIIVLRVRVGLGSTLPATHMHVSDTVVYNAHDRQLRKIVCPGFLHIRQHGHGYYIFSENLNGNEMTFIRYIMNHKLTYDVCHYYYLYTVSIRSYQVTYQSYPILHW